MTGTFWKPWGPFLEICPTPEMAGISIWFLLFTYVIGAEHEYDNLGFSSFRHHKRFDPEALIAGDLQRKSRNEAVSFLQAWCFFGLLEETVKPQNVSLASFHVQEVMPGD
jgi:hypothetical protein